MENAYDEKMEDMGGQRQVGKVKDGLRRLMLDIKQARFQEGTMMNGLFRFKHRLSPREKGRNHLFDNIDNEQLDTRNDFTEDDLKPSAASPGTEDLF